MKDNTQLLESAASVLSVAIASIHDDGQPHEGAAFSDIREAVRAASERISEWLNTDRDYYEEAAFNALDACAVVGAVMDAGIIPQSDKTCSPIRGTLTLAAQALEAFIENGPPADPEAATERQVA